MGKLRHRAVDWRVLALLDCCITKKGTQISLSRAKCLVAKRVFNQKENTRLLKESLCCYFWEWCLEPTCLAPDFHSSLKHREPFSSVFTSTVTNIIRQNTPGRKDFQLLLKAAVIASRAEVGHTSIYHWGSVQTEWDERRDWQPAAMGQVCTEPLLLLQENLMGEACSIADSGPTPGRTLRQPYIQPSKLFSFLKTVFFLQQF